MSKASEWAKETLRRKNELAPALHIDKQVHARVSDEGKLQVWSTEEADRKSALALAAWIKETFE